jgi:hypothetical protein
MGVLACCISLYAPARAGARYIYIKLVRASARAIHQLVRAPARACCIKLVRAGVHMLYNSCVYASAHPTHACCI